MTKVTAVYVALTVAIAALAVLALALGLLPFLAIVVIGAVLVLRQRRQSID